MFSERLERFIESLGETPSSIEPKIEVSKGAIYKPIKNKKTVGVEVMEKIFSKYPELNLEWLISGNGEMLKNCTNQSEEEKNEYLISVPNAVPNSKSEELGTQMAAEPVVLYLPEPTRQVIMLTQEAAASISGVVSGQQQPEEAGRILLPATMLGQNGAYYGFKVRNDSMHPTLYDGDWVVGRYLEAQEWAEAVNERIYIISTREDGVKIKRVRNRLSERGKLCCRSDNKHYPAFEVPETEIVSLFEVKCRLSFNFPNEPALITERMARLEDRMADLEKKKP